MRTASLSSVERAVLSAYRQDDLVQLARTLISVPSQIPHEAELSRVLAAHLSSLKCFDDVQLQSVVGDRANVIARLRGTGSGPTLLLTGHLDMPPPAGAWTREPYTLGIEDGWLYGLGLSDMKAGVAAQFAAAVAIARSGYRLEGDLLVLAVVHHDVCGLGTKFFLDTWEDPIHAAINGEPTGSRLQLAHGGAWQFEIETRAPEVHISRAIDSQPDAIKRMRAILDRLEVSAFTYSDDHGIEGLPRMVIGGIDGGGSPSRTPGRCMARGDIRTVPGMTQERLLHELRSVVESSDPDPDRNHPASVRSLVYQRPYVSDPQWPILEAVAAAHRSVTGTGVVRTRGLPAASYVTDAADLVRMGIQTAVYGPTEWTTEPDERVRLDEIEQAARVYAIAALRFCRIAPEAGS